MVRLSVPGTLLYRDTVLRAVASVCRLLRSGLQEKQEADQDPVRLTEEFDNKVVSAVGEAFNNIALHAYAGSPPGNAQLELEFHGTLLTIRLLDTGKGFDPLLQLEPDLVSLPESHLGLFIIQECMDEVSYRRGVGLKPNVLTLMKRYFAADDTTVESPVID
ncbi:MAG TPA: ATP-binding protein [Polyangiaceae bacterium]|jgi:serine/threonine-protein kinase RsbW|nr:ATP-binding protein [Polyangiaceae bacterium]